MDRGAPLINFVCLSHQRGTPVVTVHQGQWAYCGGGSLDAQQGHLWEAKSPMSVHDLESHRVGLISESLPRVC